MPDRRRAFIPEDLYLIRWVSEAQLAPDGHHVAFVVTQMDRKADDYRSQVWLVPTGGRRSRPQQLTFGPKRDTFPRWSPDGRTLAFISDRGEKAQIWLLPVEGGEARQLSTLPGGASSIAWSPNGRYIAAVSQVGDEEPKLGIREITSLKYKSNGEGFRDTRRHIFVVNVGNGRARQITEGDWDDSHPTWSPDGKQIAFASARHATRDTDSIYDIWGVPATGGDARKVTDSRGPASAPLWSPDGKTIAYLGHDDPHAGLAKNYCAWAVGAERGAPRNLTASLDRCAVTVTAPFQYHPLAWSSDSSAVYFLAMDSGNVHLCRVPLDGGPIQRVAAGDRQVSEFSVAHNGAIAYTATDPVNPPEVFLKDPRGNERQLTDFNARFKGRVVLQTPQRVAYRSYDGTPIEGWGIKPWDFRPGKKYPALVNVHGGPHAQYGNVFFDEFQAQASRGYVVFYPNPRGSQGYGEGFAAAVSGDWGNKDYEDVMAGVDALAQMDFVDRERIGVIGGSYGGYLTSWIVGHTDRFRAACSERAVNNLHSMYGTSDIGSWFQEFEMGGVQPWDNPQFYLERSPIAYVRNVRTPLLILHSEQDLRCPMEQGEQLFVALKKLGQAEVAFIRFPEESHELTRSGKPSRRVRRFHYILDWFDKYLQPDVGTGKASVPETTPAGTLARPAASGRSGRRAAK